VIGNELTDKLTKEAAANKSTKGSYKRTPKKVNNKRTRGQNYKEMANRLDKLYKRGKLKRILPGC